MKTVIVPEDLASGQIWRNSALIRDALIPVPSSPVKILTTNSMLPKTDFILVLSFMLVDIETWNLVWGRIHSAVTSAINAPVHSKFSLFRTVNIQF